MPFDNVVAVANRLSTQLDQLEARRTGREPTNVFSNTTLEEDRPSRPARAWVLPAHIREPLSDDEEDERREGDALTQEMRWSARAVRNERAAETRANATPPPGPTDVRRADGAYEALNKHYRLENANVEAFTDALIKWKADDAEAHAVFHNFALKVLISSPADVRRYDTLGWYRGLPEHVNTALVKIQTHYREEAVLRLALGRAEERNEEGYSWVDDDETFAATQRDSTPFGFATNSRKNGLASFRPREIGAGTLRVLLAQLEVRLVRLEHAPREERFGSRGWQRSVDGMVSKWITRALIHIDEKLPMQIPATSEATATFYEVQADSPMQSAEAITNALQETDGKAEVAIEKLRETVDTDFVRSIKSAFQITRQDQLDVFETLMKTLRKKKAELGGRYELIDRVRERRLEKNLMLEDLQSEGAVGLGLSVGDLTYIQKKLDAAMEKADEGLGGRAAWEWE